MWHESWASTASLLTASPAPSGDEAVAARVGRAGRDGGGADVVATDVAGSHNNSHVIGNEAETLVVVGVLGARNNKNLEEPALTKCLHFLRC
jgi:hypothetical protein